MFLTQTEWIVLAVFIGFGLFLLLSRGQTSADTNATAGPEWRRTFMHFLIYMLVWIILGAFFWPTFSRMFTARGSGDAVRLNAPRAATPPPAPTPSPEPPLSVAHREGPVEVYTPKVVKVMVGGKPERVAFTLFTFSSDYHWQKGAYVVEGVNGIVEKTDSMKQYLSKIHHAYMLAQDAVVCVGTASYDLGDNKDEKFEEVRAFNRATLLISWLRPAFETMASESGRPPELFKVNLGHYTQGPDDPTQRMIVIFGVKRIDVDVSLDYFLQELTSEENKERLKENLTDEKYPFVLNKYSKFDIIPAT